MISYKEIKEIYNDIKTDKIMMWLFRGILTVVLIFVIISAILTYNDRSNGKPVNFLWGLYRKDKTDTVTVIRYDTIYNYTDPKNSSQFTFTAPVTGQNQQFGNYNKQNNYFGQKQRHVTTKMLADAIQQLDSWYALHPKYNSDSVLYIASSNDDVEAYNLAGEFAIKLRSKGFNHLEYQPITMAGVMPKTFDISDHFKGNPMLTVYKDTNSVYK